MFTKKSAGKSGTERETSRARISAKKGPLGRRKRSFIIGLKRRGSAEKNTTRAKPKEKNARWGVTGRRKAGWAHLRNLFPTAERSEGKDAAAPGRGHAG